jgi:hypothetical protein
MGGGARARALRPPSLECARPRATARGPTARPGRQPLTLYERGVVEEEGRGGRDGGGKTRGKCEGPFSICPGHCPCSPFRATTNDDDQGERRDIRMATHPTRTAPPFPLPLLWYPITPPRPSPAPRLPQSPVLRRMMTTVMMTMSTISSTMHLMGRAFFWYFSASWSCSTPFLTCTTVCAEKMEGGGKPTRGR